MYIFLLNSSIYKNEKTLYVLLQGFLSFDHE